MTRLQAMRYALNVLEVTRRQRDELDPFWVGYSEADPADETLDDAIETLEQAIRDAERRSYRKSRGY